MVYSGHIKRKLLTYRYKLMAQQTLLNTLDDRMAFAKQLIKEQETEYQLHFAAGNFNEMMAAKRELAKQRNIFGKLLKEKMGR
jgi:hypothetical protein